MKLREPLRDPIRGAGGKGGGGGGQELPDSIRSTQMADVLDLLGEGEIEGLTFGLRSAYLDGVPLQNADGSFNFENVQVQVTAGTQGQAAIAGADGVLNEVGVQVAVVAATAVVRTISNAAVDTARVTIEVPQLTRQDAGSGDLVGSSFEWAVDVQSAGGGFVQVFTDVVEGKTTSRYTRSKEFALAGSAPWDIRVRRVTPDSTSQLEVNAFRWGSYTEVQSLKLRYPNSALVRLRVGAQQFSRIPTRAYDLMGLRVRVPTNYNTRTKAYTGVWDGTFKVDWTDCPAWIYYDVVTSNRYGLGRYFDTGPNLKWLMYSIGRYSDVMVPDGRGGTEPRFRCGLNLETREQAYKVLSDLAAIFRGMAYWAGSELRVMQDAPSDPVHIFTNANVEGGKFTYTGASFNKRPSQVVVWFNDLQDFGRLVPEVVVDRELQKQRGIRSQTLSPLGVWSRGQAHRIGKWVLNSERLEGAGVSFGVGLDGKQVAPGQTFLIADSNEAGERLGGRVRSATSSGVTLDSLVSIAAGESYQLSVMLPDPADNTRLVVQKRPVSNTPGQHQIINVFPAFSQAPAPHTVWLLQSDAIEPTMWRCLGAAEKDGAPGYDFVAVRHYPQKYDLIEQGIEFDPPPVSRIRRTPLTPHSLVFTETVYALGLERRSKVTLSWPEPEPGLSFLVAWRIAGGPWTDMPATSENCVDIDALPPGLLEASVKSRNAIGLVSSPKVDSFTVVGNQVQVGSNLIDPSWWRPGAAMEWVVRNTSASTSAIVWGAGPRGGQEALWLGTVTVPPTSAGWDTGNPTVSSFLKNEARVDPTKTYRFSFPAKGLTGTPYASFGPQYQDATLPTWQRVCPLNSGVPAVDPRFFNGILPQNDRWYLVVAYVFPAGSTGVPSGAGGVFDMETGERVAATTSFCWMANATRVRTRSLHFDVIAGSSMVFGRPAVELADGTDGAWSAGPAGRDGASSITLVPSGGCTTPGPDRILKASGVTAWDSDCRSLESFVGGAWVSWQCERNDRQLMMGLNTDPASAADYQSIDFAWFCSVGIASIYESGNFVATFGAYTTATVFMVQYDGRHVRYLVNGVVVRQVAAAAGQRLYLDSSFADVGAEAKNVRFGPMGGAGADGAPGTNAQLLTLLSTAQAFTFDSAGAAAPSSQTITLTALLANIAGTATFTATGFNAAGVSLGALTLGGTGNSRTLALAAFGAAARAVVTATSGSFSDQVTIVRLRDGAAGSNGQNAVTGYLTNEAHTVSTAADGSGGSFGSAGGDFKVFNGLSEVTTGVTFSVVAGSVTGITGLAIDGNGIYSLGGMTADVGTATLRAVFGAVTLDKVYTISRSRQGVQGNPGLNAQLLALLTSAQAFTFNGAGVATPGGQVVTLTALLSNLAGTASFSAIGYDASGTSLGALTLGGSGNSRTLSAANFGASARAVVQATLGSFSDQVTIVRLRDGGAGLDGQNSVTGYLTNESHAVAVAADGTGGNYSSAGGDFKVFNGLVELNAGVAFSVVAGSVSGITGLSIDAGTGIYSLTGMTADTGTATLRAVFGSVTIDKVYSISRSKAGGGVFTWVVSGGAQGDGTTLRRVAGTGAWDAHGYSAESYVNGAYASARAGRTDGSLMFGLNSDPGTDASYTSLDYAWYFRSDGLLEIWESAAPVGSYGSYTTATVLSVVYDGKRITYLKDGTVMRALPVANGLRLHLDTSLFELNTELNGVVFGPSGARGDDGLPANKLVRAYIRSATLPSTPTGNGIPSGWAAAPPAANGLPLYMTESTQTPADVLVGSWSAPVKADATAAPGPVAQVGTIAVVATSGSSTALASLAFKSNGTITGVRNSGSPVVQGHYYFPTTVGIGTGLYVNVVRESGNTLDGASSALNTWLELTSDRTYQLSRSSPAIARTVLSFLIASDSAGVNIVGAGNLTLDVVRE